MEKKQCGIPDDYMSKKAPRGVASEMYPWNLKITEVERMHKAGYTGTGIKYGIIDSGITDHADLPKIDQHHKKSFAFNTTEDGHGHGTGVFGIKYSILLDGTPYISKELDDNGLGEFSSIAQAVMWMIAEGVTIINISITGTQVDNALEQALKYAHSKRVAVVVAAGNHGENTTRYPASSKYTISVGMVNKALKVHNKSNRSANIMAPGVDVICPDNKNGYKLNTGTSQGAPHVAGIIGLIQEKYLKDHNDLPSIDEIKKTLKRNSIDLGESGDDLNYGMGLVRTMRPEDYKTPDLDLDIKPKLKEKLTREHVAVILIIAIVVFTIIITKAT